MDSITYTDDDGQHTECVTFRAAWHLHTRHKWPDGCVTRGRYWLSEWREKVKQCVPEDKGNK